MALIVKDLCFTYKRSEKDLILNRVNINVPESVIYALLGPSGSGKTTLFKTIVGLCKPKSGDVFIFGSMPGSKESGVPGRGVGYMPQELAVQHDLTIREILNYFGNVHCLESSELKKQIINLIALFDLPKNNQLIGSMSEGQKRRVSLAITMLHNPRLLILDEPTVGVDPILAHKIWNFLITKCRVEKVTVILTTHYTQEALKADLVAFIRKGSILDENTPSVLLKKYSVNTMDEVFFILSSDEKQQNEPLPSTSRCHQHVEDSILVVTYTRKPLNTVLNFHEKISFLRIMSAVIQKYVIATKRSPFAMTMMLLSTLSLSLYASYIFGKVPQDLTVAIVVNDHKVNYTTNRCFNNTVNAANYETDICGRSENDDDNWIPYLPDTFERSINKKVITFENYSDFSSAYEDLRKRKVYAVIHLKANFSRCYIESDLILNPNQDYVTNSIISCGSIHLFTDPTNIVLSTSIEFTVRDAVRKLQQQTAVEFDINPEVIQHPLKYVPIYGELSSDDFFNGKLFIVPGFLWYGCYASNVAIAAITFLMEQNNIMDTRNYVSGLSSLHLLAGQVIVRQMFFALSVALNLLFVIYVVNVPCEGSLVLVYIILLLTSVIGDLHGMLTAIIIPHQIFCFFFVVGYAMNINFAAAIFWPFESQPYYFRWTHYGLPWYYELQTLRTLMSKGGELCNDMVWPGFAISFVWLILSFISCGFFFNISKR